MAEPISIQQLKDASEDAISLAEFINKPENAMITRRLASDIHSLQYYLEYMKSFAQRSYETYDEMIDNASNLSENISIFVTNDSNTSKNGIYTYNGTSFVKGEYQPENAAKEFVEARLGGLQVFDGKVRSQDVSTSDGSTQEVKNTEFRNELDSLPFEDGVLADTFVTVTSNSKISEPVNQRALTDAILGNTYYAKLNGFKAEVGFDNSPVWDALSPKLTNGDIVIFEQGKFRFSEAMEVLRGVTIKGKSKNFQNGTVFEFYGGASGVVRKYPYITLEDISINGTQTTTKLDPLNNVFGTVGLLDVYSTVTETGVSTLSGYSNLKDVVIRGFDTGRVVVPTDNAVWSGAYRENYNVWVQGNRIGLVHNGSTDEKYYGGILSDNSEIGLWAWSSGFGGTFYNNIKFIGTTIEGNGVSNDVSIADGYLLGSPKKCNMYIAGFSSVYLIGSYNEKTHDVVRDGGLLTRVGNHQHWNTRVSVSNGSFQSFGENCGNLYRLPLEGFVGNWMKNFSLGTSAEVNSTSDGVALKIVADVASAYVFSSPEILLTEAIPVRDIERMLLELDLKSISAKQVTCRPLITVTADDGSWCDLGFYNYDTLKQVHEGRRKLQLDHELKVSGRRNSLPVGTAGFLNPDANIVSFKVRLRPTGTMSFNTEPFELHIYGLGLSVFSKTPVHMPAIKHTRGTESAKPLLREKDAGTLYFNTVANKQEEWNGTAWEDVIPPPDRIQFYTNDDLLDSSLALNVSKYRGETVFNMTDKKLYISQGGGSSSYWVSADGLTTLIPV